jgi:Ca-activated chloride channel family protein
VTFDYPALLSGLALLLPLAVLSAVHYRLRKGVLAFFAPATSRRGAEGRELRFRYLLSAFFFLLFSACVIIALAGPRWGTRLVPEFRRGADVVLAVDLSRSMDVRDGGEESPSRLEQAAAIAGELAALSRGARFAVAVGKSAGVLAVPLTDDTEAVTAFLEGISTSLVTGRGTNLESLITAASGAFQGGFPTLRHIILFSDGEAHQGSLSRGIEQALAGEISISAVGLGSETGGAVPPLPGQEAGSGGIMSFLRRDALRNAAERTGGVYLDGAREYAAAFLADHTALASPETGGAGAPGPAGFRRERVSRSYIFILAALAALGISGACGKKRRRHETQNEA